MKRYQVKSAGSKLDWATASPLTDFAFPWEPTPNPFTEFRALCDAADDRLHFRFECIDHDLVKGEGKTVKERVLGSDRVEIFFTPELRLDPYFCLEMSPWGDAYVYRAKTYRQFDDDFSWPGLLLETAVQGERYTVVGSLPLQTLRDLRVLRPGSRELWAGLYRAEFSQRPDGSVHQGWMSWVDPATAQPDFHVPTSFGVLELPT
jgi:hypothetical protein